MRLFGPLMSTLSTLPAPARLGGIPAGILAQVPLLMAQGLWVRLRTPTLPAAGPPFGGVAWPEVAGDIVPLRLLVLGESTAAGVGASSHAAGLTGQIAGALAGLTLRPVKWLAVGRNGATAASAYTELLPRLARDTATDVVVVALGVNDVTRLTAPEQWRSDLARLVDALAERTGGARIVICGVPAVERFPALPDPLGRALGRRARRLDAIAAEVSGSLSGALYCATPLPDPEHFAADGFHPGELGYAGWGRLLAAAIETALPMGR